MPARGTVGTVSWGLSPPEQRVHRWVGGSVILVQVGGAGGGGVGNPCLAGHTVGQRQQSAQPSRHRVFGQWRDGEAAEFLQRGVLVMQPEGTGRPQVPWCALAEQL